MKRTIIGIALLTISMVADIVVTISASIVASKLTEWYTSKGRFLTALTEYGLFLPYMLAKIFLVIAVLILIKEYFSKETDINH